MLTIGIIDDGLGAYPTLSKLKQAVSADFVCMLVESCFPLGEKRGRELFSVGENAVDYLKRIGCDAVVLSSIALSSCCFKKLSSACDITVFGSEAPVMHASTYTASSVLAVGDRYALKNVTLGGVISCPLPEFPEIAKTFDERRIVEYITENLERYDGRFDCIALANSSMNFYRRCFSRVFPNVQIFDSLEGIARRVRKKYKKLPKEEGSVTVINEKGEDVSARYPFFTE